MSPDEDVEWRWVYAGGWLLIEFVEEDEEGEWRISGLGLVGFVGAVNCWGCC